MSSAIPETLKAFEAVTAPGSSTHNVWVRPYSAPTDPSLHQFVFFFKPEATAVRDGVKLGEVLSVGLKTLESHGVKIGAIRVAGGPWLEKHDIMVNHYGVISKISKRGLSEVSEAAKGVMNDKFKAELAAGVHPVGAHQFLAANKEFTPLSLLTLNENIGITRLAGGTYMLKMKIQGKDQLILNAFHPYQLVPYTTTGNAIIIYECNSTMPWADLRGKLCGTTDPETAEEGAIRRLFLQKKTELGFVDVSKGANGVHMSAGPLEAMVELRRFFSEPEQGEMPATNTAFGALLAKSGVSAEQLTKVVSNPTVQVGEKRTSLFDLTEEKDAQTSVELILPHVSKL